MGVFGKLFGNKPPKPAATPTPAPKPTPTPTLQAGPAPKLAPQDDPNMMKVFDGYGREFYITKQEWRDNILRDTLEKARNDPAELYTILVSSLRDGFAADIVPYAERLREIDPIPSRGATVLGIVYMEVKRLDEAQRVFEGFIAKHGEDGVILTNLAKVQSSRGDNALAEKTLWHALEMDPNQDNGLVWYAAIQRERGGEAAWVDAFRRVAGLSRSWRARLWLAADALKHKDLAGAEKLYQEALELAGKPAPADLLMQMSGDLGNSGCLAEIVRLVEPHFDPAVHGLPAGNNLIKANVDLGRLDGARRVLDKLYAQKRPDWRETLAFWDTELAKTRVAAEPKSASDQELAVTIVSVIGPLWTRNGSPFASLLPNKLANAPQVAVFGSTVLKTQLPEHGGSQLSDGPGRLSRAVPLVLAEHVHLVTDAVGVALIPWVGSHGFAVFGSAYDDRAVCDLAGKGEHPPEIVVGVVLDTTQSAWKLNLRLLRRADGQRLAETAVEVSPEDPGPAVERLAPAMLRMLSEHADVRTGLIPAWYQRPAGPDSSDYLLRLEQQLAVASMQPGFLEGGGLSGEHEIIDGILQLCVQQPANSTVRMVLAHTLALMKAVRPDILSEYREKVGLLRRRCRIAGSVGQLADKAIADAVGGGTE